MDREGDDGRQAGLLDHVEGDQGLLAVGDRLGDDEVDARVDRPADLLHEHSARRRRRFLVVAHIQVGVGDVARQQGARVGRDLPGDGEGLAVHLLQQVLFADDAQLLAVRVIGKGLDHVGARVHELAVQAAHYLGVVEHDLRDKGAGLEVAAPLALEEVSFRADDRALGEPLEQAERGACGIGHVVFSLHHILLRA